MPILTDLPERMLALDRDFRGYPVPWFVLWQDGKPIFPVMDRAKWIRAIKEKLCWVCGQPLGVFQAFVVGPMCGITRTSAEPPSHLECAEFSVKNCPFLVNPNMKRIENEITKEGVSPGGVMNKRNPGVTLLWVTKKHHIFRDDDGNPLLQIGEPTRITLWREGRLATAEEVHHSIATGLSALTDLARPDWQLRMLQRAIDDFRILLTRIANYVIAELKVE